MRLQPIVRYCRQLEDEFGWGFVFQWDQGTFETAMIIIDEKPCRWKPGRLVSGWESIATNERMFCPDIVEFDYQMIIEFEETPGKPRSGARLAKKGHDPDGMDKRTSNRDEYYAAAGFRVLKIYDYDIEEIWKKKIKKFLVSCWTTKPAINRT